MPLLLILGLALCSLAACSSGDAAGTSPLARFTGAHSRAVWVQSDGKDPYAAGDNLVLMGLDTADGRGERVILSERRSYVKPMLAPRGSRIVFSRRPGAPGGPEIMLVNFDGSGLRRLSSGFALAVWSNPADGTEWVYAGLDAPQDRPYDSATVVRFPIDDPSARETVWNKTLVSGDTFQVSADGRYAGGLFPWPEAGVADLQGGSWKKLGEGCWTALCNVRGPVMWYFDGAHRNLTLVDVRTDKRWTVNINGVPGFGNDEVYHPRWTNHPRFMTMSGPYNQGGQNQVRSGGAQTEVYVGRFSADYSHIEEWHRLTQNGAGDSYPDVWIDRAKSPHQVAAGAVGPPTAAPRSQEASAPAAARSGRVVIEGRLVKMPTIPSPASIAPYRNALVVHEYDVTRVVEGSYSDKQIIVAQWVIRDGQVLPDARKQAGSAHKLTVERYDAHPELEGERLLSATDSPKLTLYYNVER